MRSPPHHMQPVPVLHTIRIHQPREIPKQWVCGPVNGLRFTEVSSEAGQYRLSDVINITELLRMDYPNAVIATNAT